MRLRIAGARVVDPANGVDGVADVFIADDRVQGVGTMPDGFEADLRISPGRGDILTDFDVEVQPTDPKVERGEHGGGYRVEMGTDVHAAIGDGGPTVRFKTFNGDIFIRRTKM